MFHEFMHEFGCTKVPDGVVASRGANQNTSSQAFKILSKFMHSDYSYWYQ